MRLVAVVVVATMVAAAAFVFLVDLSVQPGRAPATAPGDLTPAEVATACGTLVGKGVGCGHRVGELDDRCVEELREAGTRGDPDTQTLMKIYQGALAFGLEQQKAGRGTESCEAVRRTAEGVLATPRTPPSPPPPPATAR